MALVLTVSISVLALFISYHIYRRRRHRLPPGPFPWPVVGNLYNIEPVKFRCYDEWTKIYGPIISVWFGSNLNVVVSTAELAKQVLKEWDQKLANRHRSRSSEKFSQDGTDLIWADYGPHYIKMRKVCTVELFSGKRLEALRPVREDEVNAMVASIFEDCMKPGQSLVLRKYVGRASFNHITRLVFGKTFEDANGVLNEQGKEFQAILANGHKLGASLTTAEHIPCLRWMFPLEESVFAVHGGRRERLTRAIVDEHREARQKISGSEQHFVGALLDLEDNYDLSEDNIHGLLWDMITAGMDTTAIGVEWAMAELIKNPRVQKKAQEELDRVVGVERVMSELDIPNLPYLRCVFKEALRLHPPTPVTLPHRSSDAVKLGGYSLPKGSIVHVNVWAVGRDPAAWKNPREFRPERFIEEDVDMKGHDFRLLPFGAGRRACPGAQLGISLGTSMLGHLLHHFDWATAYGITAEEVDLAESPGIMSYMSTPLKVVASPRLPSRLYKSRGSQCAF